MIIVNDLSDKISTFYFSVNKKVNNLIEKTIDQNLDKEKRAFIDCITEILMILKFSKLKKLS